MHFKWLLFDIDNTLLDFNKASKLALWATYTDFGASCTEEIYRTYKVVNGQVWAACEQGLISAKRLRVQRFEALFTDLGQAPATPAVFSVRYLENLVLLSEAYAGVTSVLVALKRDYRLGVITNGLREVQRPRLARLRLDTYFDSIVVSDELGAAKPHHAFFEHTYRTLDDAPDKDHLLVIGDNLHSDIKGGIDFGVPTCWISHGQYNTTAIQPNFTLNKVLELPDLLAGKR